MRLLLWLGNEANQRALACKLSKEFTIVGIVSETRKHKRKITLRKLVEFAFEKIFLSKISKAWTGMQSHYESLYPHYPETASIDVENINSEEAFRFSQNLNPDLILVSGTRLVKDRMLSVEVNHGIMNLHTGLSPYIKGGPNCTNWCIATQQYHLAGNTIMWIDSGIDSGNIVCSEFAPINWKENFLSIHIAVMEHAHDLYVRAIRFISNGGKSSVEQSRLAKGITYYTRDWTLTRKIDLVKNQKKVKSLKEGEIKARQQNIKTIALD